jgi:hypothetical protein
MRSHVCKKCGDSFTSARSRHLFCSKECRGYSSRSTAEQYSQIDDNLPLYLNRLLYKRNNIEGKSRKNIDREQLMDLWLRQDGRCAMSGVPMTCRTKQGERFPYNASIDRIVAGGPYERDNIQLVCTIVNTLMKDFSKEDFVRLCASVSARSRS